MDNVTENVTGNIAEYQRKVRFEYFKVVARRIDQPVDTPDIHFNLEKWISIAEALSLEGRTFDYYSEQARLDRLLYRDIDNYWFMNFVRLRETNLPIKVTLDKESTPIDLADDEYIGEDVNSIYDPSLEVLMLQRNKSSLGQRGLEHYINLLWKKAEGVEIFLRPIIINDGLSTAKRKGNDYRKLTVRFAEIRDRQIEPKVKGTLISIYDRLKEYSAVNAELTITVGNSKTPLNNETVKDSIDSIMENKTLFSKAEVNVKYDDSPVEIVDLFTNILHDFIIFSIPKKTALGSEYAELMMSEKFKDKKGIIVNALN